MRDPDHPPELVRDAQDPSRLRLQGRWTLAHANEIGLRLRYQFIPEFAPYVGVSYERSFGGTADFARARGEDAEAVRALVGIRTWF